MFLNLKSYLPNLAMVTIVLLNFSCQKENPEPTDSINDNVEYVFLEEDPFNVSKEVALEAAIKFAKNSSLIGEKSSLRSKSENVEVDEIITVPDKNGEPSMYIIKYAGEGFLILSATFKEEPILAYSSESEFDLSQLTPGMAEWLYNRMSNIQYIRHNNKYKIPQKVSIEWNNTLKRNTSSNSRVDNLVFQDPVVIEGNGPLLTTKWGQYAPFNNLVPYSCSTGKAPAGSIAIALGQVLKYYSYGNNYNWSIMPKNRYNRTSQSDQEVARLVRDLGNWTATIYDCQFTESFISSSEFILKAKFGFASSGTTAYLSSSAAQTKVKKDILLGHPVIMSGYQDTYIYYTGWWIFRESHVGYSNNFAWVCDGYQLLYSPNNIITNPLFVNIGSQYSTLYHMNWGMDGAGNGWYNFNNIENTGLLFKQNGVFKPANFQYERQYLTGIRP